MSSRPSKPQGGGSSPSGRTSSRPPKQAPRAPKQLRCEGGRAHHPRADDLPPDPRLRRRAARAKPGDLEPGLRGRRRPNLGLLPLVPAALPREGACRPVEVSSENVRSPQSDTVLEGILLMFRNFALVLAGAFVVGAVSVSTWSAGSMTITQTPSPAATENNPLMSPSPLPFGAPQFDKIKDADFTPAFEAGMKAQIAEIAAIADRPAPPTFDNT